MTATEINMNLEKILRNQQKMLNAIQSLNERLDQGSTSDVQKGMTKVPEMETPKIHVTSADLEQQVTDMIHFMGVPAHIKGYQYLRIAIMMVVEDPTNISAITKVLYPTIAKQYKTEPSRVERAIRHAIEVSWARQGYEAEMEVFKNTIDPNKGKPTNSEFIAILADKIRMDNRMRAV